MENYALYLTGIFVDWLQYRHRYQRRPVDAGYYANMGRAGYRDAAERADWRGPTTWTMSSCASRLLSTTTARLTAVAREYLFD